LSTELTSAYDCINVGICIFANRMCNTHTETRRVSPTINIMIVVCRNA